MRNVKTGPEKMTAKIYAIMALTTVFTFGTLVTGYQLLFRRSHCLPERVARPRPSPSPHPNAPSAAALPRRRAGSRLRPIRRH